MDQESMGSSMKPPLPKWLMITLAIVVVAALGFGGWYVLGKKGGTTIKTSPSPTLSAVLSPSPGATSPGTTGGGTGTTGGTGEQTATPTSTSTPTQTPPAGWKLQEDTLLSGGGSVYYAKYQLFIKDGWTSRPDSAFVTWPNHIIYYGDNPYCGTSPTYDPNIKPENCFFRISGGDSSSQTDNIDRYSYAVPNTDKFITLSFYPMKPLSESDRKIILDSVQAIEGH